LEFGSLSYSAESQELQRPLQGRMGETIPEEALLVLLASATAR